MNQRMKLRRAVYAGTFAIEVTLFVTFWFAGGAVLRMGEPFIQEAFWDGRGISGELTFVSALAALALLFAGYHHISNYLGSRMCWALVRHFHGRR